MYVKTASFKIYYLVFWDNLYIDVFASPKVPGKLLLRKRHYAEINFIKEKSIIINRSFCKVDFRFFLFLRKREVGKMKEEKKYELVKFVNEGLELEVNVSLEEETIWLTQLQIAQLFGKAKSTINEHIKNILSHELEEKDVVRKFGKTELSSIKTKPILMYNLDLILAVGYRVNSKKGIVFRKWATNVLKKYLVDGYAINEKRLKYLEKQINVISIASRLDEKLITSEGSKILETIIKYNKALSLLDDYDHQTLTRPDGTLGCYVITYEECRKIIDSMKFDSTIFGVEKDGSFNSSINAIYQTAFGEDVYKTVEEKAANLLYFITKNHSFADGNKRIAASIFLYFLDRNNMLYINGEKRLSDSALVAITILIAESKPEEKEIIVDLVMNFLTID